MSSFDFACASTAIEPQAFSQSVSYQGPLSRPNNGGDNMHISHGPYARRVRGNSRKVLWDSREVAIRYKEVLIATYDGDASKHKSAAADHGSSPRAAENWFAGDNSSSLTGFLNAYHGNPTFKAWARKILLLEEDHDPEFQAQLAKFVRAAQKLHGGGDANG